METNRKNILLAWFGTGAVASAISSMISMLYWQFTYIEESNVNWSPISDALGMFMIMPFGWVMSILTPAGWLSIIGLGIALYKFSFKPLLVSIVGSIIFGLYWPKFFVAMMGI